MHEHTRDKEDKKWCLRSTVRPTSGLLFLSDICHISNASLPVSGRRRKRRISV